MIVYSGACIVLISIASSAFTVWGAYAIFKAAYKPKQDRPYTFTEQLKEQRMPSGFFVIAGQQGAGKTSLMAAITITDYLYHGRERLDEARAEIEYMNAIDSSWQLHTPLLAYRGKDAVHLDPRAGVDSLHIDITRFGLPGGSLDVQHLPPGTFLCFPEIDADLNCREWTKTPMEIIDAIKWLRHQDLTIIADMQSFDRVDAALRELTTDLWYVIDRRDRYERVKWWSKRKKLASTEWTFIWLKPQQNAVLRDVLRNDLTPHVEKMLRKCLADGSRICRFVFEGNIYERYNSHSGKAYFYRGLEDFYVESHVPVDYSRASVEAFSESNPLTFSKKNGGEK